MSALYEMYKEFGMEIAFNGTYYGLQYLRENTRSKKSGYPKYRDFSLVPYLTERNVLFTVRVEETGVARVSSIKDGTLFTTNEAEILRSKGLLIVPKKLVQH